MRYLCNGRCSEASGSEFQLRIRPELQVTWFVPRLRIRERSPLRYLTVYITDPRPQSKRSRTISENVDSGVFCLTPAVSKKTRQVGWWQSGIVSVVPQQDKAIAACRVQQSGKVFRTRCKNQPTAIDSPETSLLPCWLHLVN